MKKRIRQVTAIGVSAVMALSLTACSGSSSSEGNELKKCKIGVAFYADSGPAVDGTKAYLESLSSVLNTEYEYTVLTQTDESANLTKIQQLISSGVDGIICSMDLGMNSIIDECEAAGVYIGGWLSDYNTSYTTAYEKVFQSDYFVGTVADGPCGDEMTAGQDYFDSLLEYNERNPENAITHVAVTAFPSWAFPTQQILVDQFYAAAEEYNQTAETLIVVDPLDEATDILQFAAMDSTYFAKHEGIQAIMSFAADTFVYPTMVASGVDKDIKLFACGYSTGNEDNFGTTGNQTYQQCMSSAVEAITYPLVLIVNKVNGAEFADQPEDAERVSVLSMIMNSDEDMDAFLKSISGSGKLDHVFLTPEEVLNLTVAGNSDATYAGLKEILNHMTVSDIK